VFFSRVRRLESSGTAYPTIETMTSLLDAASVAGFLADHPQFFEEHADLLSKVRLSSPLGARTVSLQERQAEVLREKFKGLELRLAGLMRVGEENDALHAKYLAWTRSLLLARNDVDLPHILVDGLCTHFGVPQATLRIWKGMSEFAHTWFAAEVSEDARLFSNGLASPYCGANNDFEAATWLDEPGLVKSVALLALRSTAESDAFGLLVLGSPDPGRFRDDMATDFLSQIAGTGSAALACLLD
jgi:uncharacterized protein YigA (DUF484 family)